MATETAIITRAFKRGAAWQVDGKVLGPSGWLNASFVATARDVEHMSRDAFRAFALRKLPECTEDKRWAPNGEVLV